MRPAVLLRHKHLPAEPEGILHLTLRHTAARLPVVINPRRRQKIHIPAVEYRKRGSGRTTVKEIRATIRAIKRPYDFSCITLLQKPGKINDCIRRNLMESVIKVSHIPVILHIQEHPKIGSLLRVHINILSNNTIRALIILHGIHDALFHKNKILLLHIGNHRLIKGSILPLPGLFQLFLRPIFFFQKLSIKLHKCRREISILIFRSVTKYIYRIPLRGSPRRQKISDYPVRKRKRIHLITEFLQRFSRRLPPLFGSKRIHSRNLIPMHLRSQDCRLMASILISNQLILILLHPVYRRMQPDSHDNISIRYFSQKCPGVLHKRLHPAVLMLLYSGFIHKIPPRPQPVRICHQKENLQPRLPQPFNIFSLMKPRSHSHRRICPAFNH